MTRTVCEQAVIDLQTYKDALAQLLMGRVVEVRQADKMTSWGPGNIDGLRELIRMKQAEVDACNGVRRGSGFRFMPCGW